MTTPAPLPSDSPTGVWYAIEANARSGPWTVGALHDRRAAGLIDDGSLVWTEGMAGWTPVRDVFTPEGTLARAIPWPGAAKLPPAIGAEGEGSWSPRELSAGPPVVEAARSSAPQPWRRWAARILDVWCTAIVVGVFLGILDLAIPGGQFAASFSIFLLHIPLEAFCLATLGTTPGKALLNVRVREADGARLSLPRALSRAAHVWAFGLAAGVPLANLVVMNHQRLLLTQSGATSYDAEGRFVVTYAEVGLGRALAIVLFVVLFAGLVALGAAAK